MGSSAKRRAELDQQYRQDTQRRLQGLRADLKTTERAKRDRLLEVKALCERAGSQLERRIAARRRQFEEEVAAERFAQKAQCRTAAERARAQADRHLGDIDLRMREEKSQRRRERIWQGKTSSEGQRRTGLADRVAESDAEVEHNIEHALLPVWRKMRRIIRPTERMTRTEAFLHWVHDHEAEVSTILADHAERVAELTETQDEYEARRPVSADDDDDGGVPF